MKPNPNIGHQQFARLQLHIGAECWLGSCGLQRNFCLQQLVYRFVGQTSLIIWWALAFHIRWGTGARLQTRYSWFGPGLGPSLFLFWSWSLPMTCTLVSSFPAAAGCSSLAAPLGASSRCKDEGWNPRKSCIASTLVSRGICTKSRLQSCSFWQFSCKPRESFPCWVSLLMEEPRLTFALFTASNALLVCWAWTSFTPQWSWPFRMLQFLGLGLHALMLPLIWAMWWFGWFYFSKLNEQRVLMTLSAVHSSCWAS